MSKLNQAPSFEIDAVDKTRDEVVVAIHARFTRALSEWLTQCRNPAIYELGCQIAQAGCILQGADPNRYPKLADKVTDDIDLEADLKKDDD